MEISCCMNEFLEIIAYKKIWVYGAGYVANRFLEALKKHGMESHVQGYIVSQKKEDQEYINGLPVKSIENMVVDDASIICIAVHEVYKNQIELELTQRDIFHYIWIYPFLCELYMGMPIKEKEWVDTIKIIPKDERQYAMAVRWAAISDFYGIYPGGLMLYKRAMAIHSNADTGEARAIRFINLIKDWDTYGYRPMWQISINTHFEIIDGEHRVALALYHGQAQVQCKIYDGNNIHEKKTLMTEEVLLDGGFIREEISGLDEINKFIKNMIHR